ncbi:MAG TPA: ATP-binding protein [Bacteroidales bacterium]|nr:ATP-binding protein [Bacteroidales bacterium]
MEEKAEKQLIRIAITGPESTGKSWLAMHLARHYNTLWVKEYAREYLDKIGRPYIYHDILEIAKGQLLSENSAAVNLAEGQLLFCDTESIVTRIWCMVKYGRCHRYINSLVKSHRYDLYLLCDIDLPWEYDPLREHPQKRGFLFELYKSELEKNGLPYVIVNGTGDNRLQLAIKAVNHLLMEKKASV